MQNSLIPSDSWNQPSLLIVDLSTYSLVKRRQAGTRSTSAQGNYADNNLVLLGNMYGVVCRIENQWIQVLQVKQAIINTYTISTTEY